MIELCFNNIWIIILSYSILIYRLFLTGVQRLYIGRGIVCWSFRFYITNKNLSCFGIRSYTYFCSSMVVMTRCLKTCIECWRSYGIFHTCLPILIGIIYSIFIYILIAKYFFSDCCTTCYWICYFFEDYPLLKIRLTIVRFSIIRVSELITIYRISLFITHTGLSTPIGDSFYIGCEITFIHIYFSKVCFTILVRQCYNLCKILIIEIIRNKLRSKCWWKLEIINFSCRWSIFVRISSFITNHCAFFIKPSQEVEV